MGANFDELTGHLSPAHTAYFKKWHEMMSLEEKHALAPRKVLPPPWQTPC
jgi:hypothetical protein